jgi:large subunit ribosomal protein L23
MATTTFPQNEVGPRLEAYQVVIQPIVTEKGTHQSQHAHKDRKAGPAYSFMVNPWASKLQIRAAVEDLFNVRVAQVRTQNRKGKMKKDRRRRERRLSNWKKAIVTLHKDSPAIEFF